MKGKISVIIPTFNRGHLILETLESLRKQDYTDWECIIVDDHSTDSTWEITEGLIKADNRFRIVRRPDNRKKGANTCRNYGFEICSGDFVHWFDSDDIMVWNHLSTLMAALENSRADFAIGDTLNFREGIGLTGKPYDFNRSKASFDPNQFGKQSIGWITNDFLGKKEILNQLKFNESLRDGDEYNFFTRLLHENVNGIFVNKVITYRRLHDQTISNHSKLTELEYYYRIIQIKFFTCLDIEKYQNLPLISWFLSGYMQYAFEVSLMNEIPPFFNKAISKIYRYFGTKNAMQFCFSILSAKFFGKGYRFLHAAKRKKYYNTPISS